MHLRLSLALLPLFPALLFAQPRISDKNIKIISATQESWSPGIVQNNSQPGGGMMYQVKAEIKKDGEFAFDSLVTLTGSLPLEVIKNTTRNYKGPFRKGESILLIAYQKDTNAFTKNSPALDAMVAKQKKGNFFVSYRSRGKRCLLGVGEMQKKTPGQLNQ